MRHPLHKQGGFTLLEVMVAVGILAFIGSISFVTIRNASETANALEMDGKVDETVRIVLETLRREISLAYLTPSTQAINTYRTVFVAKDEDPDRLWFTSLSHHRIYQDSRECDQTEITLWTEPDPEERGAYVLLHREAPRIDNEPDVGGVIYPLAYKVKSFDLRFLNSDKNDWQKEWDTNSAETPNTLPRAVQVVLVLLTPNLEDPEELVEKTYASTILLTFGKPLQRNLLDGGMGATE